MRIPANNSYFSIDNSNGNENITSNSKPLPLFNIMVNTSGQVYNLLHEEASELNRQLLQNI